MRLMHLWFAFLIARSNEGYWADQGCNKALGLESGEISDGQITASSSFDSTVLAPFARLNIKQASKRHGAWVAGSNNVSQWLQIDLSLQYNVTRVATQGRRVSRQWVTGYNLLYSDDGVNFVYYEDEEGKPKEFTGNRDPVTIVSHSLNPPVFGRYIRFQPLAWERHICMRVEVYVTNKEGERPVGMEHGAIPDSQISASSSYPSSKPHYARLNSQPVQRSRKGSWSAGSDDSSQWLQIDLGDQFTNVTCVATQGRQDYPQWVTKYNLQYSNDAITFHFYTDEKGQAREFDGNTDQETIVSHKLNPPIKARYIRFRPVSWQTWISLRVELYGCTQECQQPLGMANGLITESQISASSEWDTYFHAATYGRLFNKLHRGAWLSLYNNVNQWIQIDLSGHRSKVTRVATQGRAETASSQWVTSYRLQHSNNAITFHYYKELGQTTDKVFTGNSDRDTVVSHELRPPIRARYIRFRPLTWNNHISMRVELFGCSRDCHDPLGMESGEISDNQIIASSEWNEKHSANLGRLHFNGGALGKASAWFSLTKDADQWLQIDLFSLGNKYTRITGVATQGRRNENYQQWVSKYKLQYSNDGVNFGYYKEQGQTVDKVFAGNVGLNETVVQHDLDPPIRARYIRFRPMEWNIHIAMRVEIYGCTQECTATAVGIEIGKIFDSQFVASSGNASLARLNGRFAWCPVIDGYGEYIQVDLGRLYRICAVATQGNPEKNKYFLKEYKLGWSNDLITWETSTEAITGNTNWRDVVKNSIPAIYARYIRLYPFKWYVRGCVRMELYGEPWLEVPTTIFTSTASDEALQGHVISTLNNTSAIDCFKLCLGTTHCESINLSGRLKMCELSGSTAKAQILEEREEFHLFKSPAHQAISL